MASAGNVKRKHTKQHTRTMAGIETAESVQLGEFDGVWNFLQSVSFLKHYCTKQTYLSIREPNNLHVQALLRKAYGGLHLYIICHAKASLY